MGVAVLVIFLIFAMLLSLASKALLAIWIYKDAEQRGMNAILWCLLMIFVSVFIILVIYLIIRRKGEVMKKNLGLLISGLGVAVLNTIIVVVCVVGLIFSIANDNGMHNMMDGYNYDDSYNYDFDYDTDSWNDEL
ncbi:hypothetical protein IA829_03980 [Listeria seeligeri]|uniref:hypothetical protein n=1 Tax=Listeria seeligeri TaxID=1640 RepID=UPI001629978D|nr:hypothetical protein [Listeria seeligeri]MBC1442837.1 hypothetical protein [Listeria seeligeri]MBC1541023.1 hypothetical protein [Listeria seeligeri]MBC1582361.1 hypothetical protein [Listeria seeligeri]MBC1772430.1 hypothetical protein [Listeria seeligeri]MBC1865485.1 hypothetical protein [Listeria seeligeri]